MWRGYKVSRMALADRISKLIPKTPGISLEEARKEEAQLNDLLSNPAERDFEDANEIWDMALKLEGITRGVGKHAGGVLLHQVNSPILRQCIVMKTANGSVSLIKMMLKPLVWSSLTFWACVL
jgi:DNA polymerase III alpha subunit